MMSGDAITITAIVLSLIAMTLAIIVIMTR